MTCNHIDSVEPPCEVQPDSHHQDFASNNDYDYKTFPSDYDYADEDGESVGSRKPRGPDSCSSEGFFVSSEDCRSFYRCVRFGDWLEKYEYECQPGLVFDQELHVCNWPWQSPKCKVGKVEGKKSFSNHESDSDTVDDDEDNERFKRSLNISNNSLKTIFDCEKVGNFPYEADCYEFYNCLMHDNQLMGRLVMCPRNYVYDNIVKACTPKPDDYKCKRRMPNKYLFLFNARPLITFPADIEFIKRWKLIKAKKGN